MRIHPELIACTDCDTVSRRRDLARGEAAACAGCGGILLRSGLGVEALFALSLSSAVLFVIANAYPVIRISVSGRHNAATLWQSVLALTDQATGPMAIVTGLALVVLPGLQIAMLCWLTGFAQFGRRAPGFSLIMRAWEKIRPWSMLEVGLLATLVTVVKLSGMLQVAAGIGVWALAGLAVLLTVIATQNIRSLWTELAEARP